MGASDDVGVENELLPVFQRLARYPGVDVNDFTTLSEAEKELDSILEVTSALWGSDIALGVGNDGISSPITMFSEPSSVRLTLFSTFTSTVKAS